MATPLLELKNIGKIYVSENNVTVGIRGVNMSFERGEFVAITGQSGSGKSTLLNVISGMDTYEEGELLVEGEPTSHFMQKDWEEYRKQYVSFIFQEYNIIESFTVLQNVELALMHMENPRERREKALELLRRVGLESHIHHKGSKLSGGQKQRTVIARALAKDSPIILADEPTGNLDSKSSEEIIRLLREVSRDKLVIIVTHNYEQVEAYATRHIRVFDGAVESDHTIRHPEPIAASEKAAVVDTAVRKTTHTLRNGLHLGGVRFTATPKLSAFLCILMTVTMLAVTLITSLTYDSRNLMDRREMFTHIDGRCVIVRRDGAVITPEELEALTDKIEAKDALHYDFMLDNTVEIILGEDGECYDFSFGYPAESLKLDAGRYPSRDDEVILEVPISVKRHIGENGFNELVLPRLFGMADYTVVGVHYYYDNTRTPRMLFTKEGYRLATAMAFFERQMSNFRYEIALSLPEEVGQGNTETTLHQYGDTLIDFDMAEGSYFINNTNLAMALAGMVDSTNGTVTAEDVSVQVSMLGNFVKYTYHGQNFFDHGITVDVVEEESSEYGAQATVKYPLEGYNRVQKPSERMVTSMEKNLRDCWNEELGCVPNYVGMVLSPDVFMDFMYKHYYAESYTQASLFFENDRRAHGKVEELRELGYTAVVSDETIEPDIFSILLEKLQAGFMAGVWLLAVVFITLFLSLCSSRAMGATKGNVAIMRSMGIPTTVVKISVYVQTLISLIPATIITAVTCAVLYLLPNTNHIFPFLHAADYLLIAAVLVLIALNLSRKYVKRMFSSSVKKTLKGGSDT